MKGVWLASSSVVTAMAVSAVSAQSTWKEDVYIDRLTNKKIVQMWVPAQGPAQQVGRPVTGKLLLACIALTDDRSVQYISAFLELHERLAINDVRARYRFDHGPVHELLAGASANGLYLSLSTSSRSDQFLRELRGSSKLRIELQFPWAGEVLLEVNTTGAGDALDSIPCGRKARHPS